MKTIKEAELSGLDKWILKKREVYDTEVSNLVTDNSDRNREALVFIEKKELGFGDFRLGYLLKLKTRHQLLGRPRRCSEFGG